MFRVFCFTRRTHYERGKFLSPFYIWLVQLKWVVSQINSVHDLAYHFKSLLILYYILCFGLPFGILPLGFASQVLYPHVEPVVELFSHDHFSFQNDISWSLSFTFLRRLFFTRPSCVYYQSYLPCFNCYKAPNYFLCCIFCSPFTSLLFVRNIFKIFFSD